MMNRNNKRFLILLLIIILFAGVFIFIKNNPFTKTSVRQKVLLFEASACSQCQKVEDFLKQNIEIEENLTIERKESEKNKFNALDLQLKAKLCQIKLNKGQKVIPLLYDAGSCIIGDQQIIDYLTELSL